MVYSWVISKDKQLICSEGAYVVDGEKLLFLLDNGMIDKRPHYAECDSGKIYTTGNGHLVGKYYWDGEAIRYCFYENSGTLRMFLESAASCFVPQVPITWTVDGMQYSTFKECVYLHRGTHERTIKAWVADKLVGVVKYSPNENKVTYFEVGMLPASCFNDVFALMGKCKFVGDVRNTVAYVVRTEKDVSLKFLPNAYAKQMAVGSAFLIVVDEGYRGMFCDKPSEMPTCRKFIRYVLKEKLDGTVVACRTGMVEAIG